MRTEKILMATTVLATSALARFRFANFAGATANATDAAPLIEGELGHTNREDFHRSIDRRDKQRGVSVENVSAARRHDRSRGR